MPSRTAALGYTTLAVLAVAGTLAGCSTSADAGAAGGADTGAAPGGDAVYTDGTYEATADYQSPNGTETIDVTLTLEGDIVTAVEVTGRGTSPDSQRYQGEFTDGISDVVVGKDIDALQVDKVGGSSLTSAGFNAALEQIKADAVA